MCGAFSLRKCAALPYSHCERSEAIQGYVTRPLDCFVALLLAMTAPRMIQYFGA